MDTQSGSLKEQWKEARREQILDAASRVFSEQGYHNAKMKDVATEAGVSNGTVYNYFKSKEEVLQALLHRLNQTEQRADAFADGLELSSFRDFYGAYAQHRLNFLEEHLDLFRALLPELLRQPSLQKTYQKEVTGPSFELAEQFLSAMIETGQMKKFDPALGARVMASQVLGLLVLRLLGDPVLAKKHDNLGELLTLFLCDGLLATPQPEDNNNE